MSFVFLAVLAVFQVAPSGCGMAHCDARMSDLVRAIPPAGAPVVQSHDTVPTGTNNPQGDAGLGCSSNGRMAVCSYNNAFGDNVVAYSANGVRLWSSGALFDSWSFTSAPMINAAGEVIAADDTKVVRFSPTGSVEWSTPTPGGIPISPVITQTGTIVLATKGGPVSAYDSSDGRLVGSLIITNPATGQALDTINTPCVSGNRVYIAMRIVNDPSNTAALVALDVDPTNVAAPLQVAWRWQFGGPSKASPLRIGNVIYFDGGRLNPGDPASPQLFAVRDDGATPTTLWAQPAPQQVLASFSQDPRGGFWVIYKGLRSIQRRSTATGQVLEALDITSIVGGPTPNIPYSALTMAGTAAQPVLLLGTWAPSLPSAYVLAIDLTTRAPLWKVEISPAFGTDNAPGQFPIVTNAVGKPVVVFSGRLSGAYFVTTP
jgi:hypothetical protein